jgi:hypothetical protein
MVSGIGKSFERLLQLSEVVLTENFSKPHEFV